MRVAYVCADPGVPAFGTKGASVHIQEMVRAWRAKGAQVHLYVVRTGDHVPDDLLDVPVTHVPVGRAADGGTAGRERAQQVAADELARAVLADGADVVHERYSLFSTALAQVTARTGAVGLLEVNAPLVEEQAQHRELVDAAGALAALRTQAAAADRVLAVSGPVSDWVRTHVPSARVVITPNGVDPGRIHAVAPDRVGTPVVVFVGTLKPWHGVEHLLDAAALARRPWQVRVVGDGPQASALRERADRLGLSVDFRGAVTPQEVPTHLEGAAVAVAPYPAGQDQYFSPLKVLEYSAAALPVVASDVGQLGDLVHDGVTGLLVPPSDPEALAAAVDALVSVPDRAERMGRAGRRRVVRQHTWLHVLDRATAGLALPWAGAREEATA